MVSPMTDSYLGNEGDVPAAARGIMCFTQELFNGLTVKCTVVKMGLDCAMTVCGGEAPHVGSVVVSTPRPSLTGKGLGVTSSVVNAIGHKDERIARTFAERAALETGGAAVCSCGIHVDRITPEQIKMVERQCAILLEKVARAL